VAGGSAFGTKTRATADSTRSAGGGAVAGGARSDASGQLGQTTPGGAGAAAGSSSPAGSSGRTTAASRGSTGTEAATQSSGPLDRLVKELPTAVLVALLAFGVIAAAMALNAYLQRRRAKSLADQRAALLSDVGVLQAALLPAVPEKLGDLEVSVAYRPAQGLAAGGDFFDVFTVSAERTGIIIGDVSGHGRESLIHAALVRYTLRTLMGEGHPLPEVLARADRYLTGELGAGFATVIVCCYEQATGELTWAKAGHEPPIIAEQPELEEEAATPLGFGLGDAWPQFSRLLAPGERVCLFTDGLVEARRRGEYLGRAQLRSLVEQGLSAQAIVERTESDSDLCSDDLAVVVLGRATEVAPVEIPSAPEAAAV
jgi:serine phosphatase RsbU (regulator of sigma subunit)